MLKKKVSVLIRKAVAAMEPEKNKKADANEPGWVKYVAMLTGILAALAGFLVVRSTTLTNKAIFESNQAILMQAQASDSWAQYQAESIKARIVETQMLPSSPLNAEDKAALKKADDDLRGRQPQTKEIAASKERERDTHMGKVQENMEQKDLLEYAGLAVQLGIALASVAAMVKKRAAFVAGALAGGAGVLIAAYALLGHLIGF